MTGFDSRTSFEWFRTMSIPPAGGDYALIRTESLDEPGHAVTPDGHRDTFFSDDPLPAGRLLFYRVLVRDPGGCPADDPYRP
jgi:hypothetical protein